MSSIDIELGERVPALIKALSEPCPNCGYEAPESSESESYQDDWKDCQRCPLQATRRNVVFASGNLVDPKIFVVGQSPGEQEDLQGKPFVGPVAAHLNGVMRHVGIDRETDCCVTNTVSCRPWIPQTGKNVPPSCKSILACKPRLNEEWNKVKDSVKCVVLVGKEAFLTWMLSESLEKNKIDPNRIRLGSVLGWQEPDEGPPAYVVYHPSYIARAAKREISEAWAQDWNAISHFVKTGEKIDPRSSN